MRFPIVVGQMQPFCTHWMRFTIHRTDWLQGQHRARLDHSGPASETPDDLDSILSCMSSQSDGGDATDSDPV